MEAIQLQLVYDGSGPVHWDGGAGAFGLQDKDGALHPGTPGAAGSTVFDFTLRVKSLDARAVVLVGDFAHGTPAERFLYLGWRNRAGNFAQRLKLPLATITADQVRQACVEGKLMALSFVTVGELYFGAYRKGWGAERLAELKDRLRPVTIVPYDEQVCLTYARIKADLQAAFLSITPPAGPPAAGSLGGATNIPAGTTLGAPAGNALVQGDNLFVPGVYQSLTSILISNDLTLDAQGDSNAVFIFQSSSTVGTAAGAASPGVHTRILLINGAKASNVWWQAATSATLGTSSEFQGNILASQNITMNTGATSCGRLLAGAFASGAFVFDANIVSVPGHSSAPASCK